MSIEAFRALVARISYKPNWRLTVWGDSPCAETVLLRIAFRAPDSTGAVPGLTERALKHAIPTRRLALWSDAEALRFIFQQILELERHEAREWFKLDGKPVDYPHGPAGELLP